MLRSVRQICRWAREDHAFDPSDLLENGHRLQHDIADFTVGPMGLRSTIDLHAGEYGIETIVHVGINALLNFLDRTSDRRCEIAFSRP